MVIKATSQDKNISPTALQKMIDYEISGAVPTIGRITSNQKMQNLEKTIVILKPWEAFATPLMSGQGSLDSIK